MLGLTVFASLLVVGIAQIPGEGPCAGQIYGDHIPDPKDCTKFYQCVSATEFHHQCPSPLHFDCVKKVCNWPNDAECQLEGQICKGLQNVTTTTSITPTVPTIEAPCTSLNPETHGDPDDCTRFTYCENGKPTIAKCPIGEFYSKDHNACIEAAECPATATTTTTSTGPTPTTPGQPSVIPPCTSFEPESLPDPNDCTKYTYCENGIPHIVQCAIGEYYSETEKACIVAAECPATSTTPTTPGPTTTTTTEKPAVYPPCTSLETEAIPYPTDCTKFFYCYGGKPYLVQCPPGMFYSKEHRGCIEASQCPGESGGTTASTTTTTTAKPTPPPIIAPCKSLDPELLEDPNDCTKYIYCWEGNPLVVQCPLGQYYSAVEKRCVVTDQCPADVTTTTTTTTTPNPIQPPCKSFGLETYPIPGDCTKFTLCFNGKPQTVSCGPGYYYDATKNGCVEANECPGTATTPTSTTTTTTTTTPSTTTSTTTPTTTTSTTTPTTTTSTTTPTTTTTTTTTSTTTTTTTESPIRPPCTSMDVETYPVPEDCTQFIYCLLGHPLIVQCEKGHFYSKAQNSCVQASQCPQRLL